MKIVTFTRDMRPWQKGQEAVLPDALAAKVVASGEATDPRPFPPQDVAPTRPVGTPTEQPQRKRYFTRRKAS
jgi:hypothetical protein